MSNTSKLRLRLTFNNRQKTFESDKVRTFVGMVVKEVAFDAADEMFKLVKSKIEKRLSDDVLSEIAKMARLYKQYVIGISPAAIGANGTLTPASKFAEGLNSSNLKYELRSGPAGDWPKRGQAGISKLKKRNGDYYLPWKQRKVGHQRWFEHSGVLGSVMGSGKNWVSWFGPIQVTVSKVDDSMSIRDYDRQADSQGTRTQQENYRSKLDLGSKFDPVGKGNIMRVQAAEIRVSAMRKITSEMLPALINGDINDMPRDGRKTGLIGLLPPQIAQHIAGSSQPENFVPYRHTLEPFLAFALTRGIPNAVMRRLEDGLGETIRLADKSLTSRGEKFSNPLSKDHAEEWWNG